MAAFQGFAFVVFGFRGLAAGFLACWRRAASSASSPQRRSSTESSCAVSVSRQ